MTIFIRRADPPKTSFVKVDPYHYVQFGSLTLGLPELRKDELFTHFLPKESEIQDYLKDCRKQTEDEENILRLIRSNRHDLSEVIAEQEASSDFHSLFAAFWQTSAFALSEQLEIAKDIVRLLKGEQPQKLADLYQQLATYDSQERQVNQLAQSRIRRHVRLSEQIETLLETVASTIAYVKASMALHQTGGLPETLMDNIPHEMRHPFLYKHLLNPPPSARVSRLIAEFSEDNRGSHKINLPSPFIPNGAVLGLSRTASGVSLTAALLGITGLPEMRRGQPEALLLDEPERRGEPEQSTDDVIEQFHQRDYPFSRVDYFPVLEDQDELFIGPERLIGPLDFVNIGSVRFAETEQGRIFEQVARKSDISNSEYDLLRNMSIAYNTLSTRSLNDKGRRDDDRTWKR